MGNIVLLDDLTINKIAAGEVIERPASAVKEIVENSIDAGADNISIEIRNGGISYIRVTDNGKGIAADDLEIAFERHATSKIRKAEDLDTVKSMGFRGEALASIAAIARVELISKTEDSEVGHKIVVEGGKIISKEEVGCPKGTTITIENLFYNTPVRYKFLKKDFTETGYIEDAITRIALVNPNISIKLINTGKTIIQTSGNGNIKDVVYGIYGKEIAENVVNVEYYFEDMAVKGVIGKPNIARSNRTNQVFFVNNRYVKDKTLASAAEQAFKGMLPIGKYAFLILNIEIDPRKVDVNVHPAKLEVRFQEENKIFKLVYHSIREALMKANLINEQDNVINNENLDKEIQRIENKAIVDTTPSEKTPDTKGFGGFLKNIMNSSKNEFQYNDGENVVEELYRDKIQKENESILNEIMSNNLATDKTADIKWKDAIMPNVARAETSKEEIKETTDDTRTSEVKDLENNYDNLTVKEDGSIELKKEDNVEQLKASDRLSIGTENLDIQPNSNLERLVKELDENLEKLSLESRNFNSQNSQNIDNSTKLVENNSQSEDVNKQEDIADNQGVQALETENTNATIQADENNEQNVENNVENLVKNENEVADANPDVKEEKDNTEEAENSKKIDDKFEEMYAKMFGTKIPKRESKEEKPSGYAIQPEDLKTAENLSLFANRNIYNRPVYKYIGIVFDSYIIIEYQNEMYIVNQHSANERIAYEKLKKNFYDETDNKDSQQMLLPDVINLSAKEMGVAKDCMETLKKGGFDVEEFGENTIKLSAVPSACMNLDTENLYLEILNAVNTVARTSKQEMENKFLCTVASKIADNAKIVLAKNDIDDLMSELLVLPQPFMNPNNEPTAIKMSKIDIEKKFSRR